jgi:uncharacterized protein
MLKNTLLQHKLEKKRLQEKKYVQRGKLSEAKRALDSDLIKVITGPRRAGKSVFSILLLEKKNFAYLNFDDENLVKIANYDKLTKTINEIYHKPEYIFFDEIQNLPKWELYINKLHRRGYNLIITGSNSRLLSKELSSVLTGRFTATEVFPFSFKEYIEGKGIEFSEEFFGTPEIKGKALYHLDKYLVSGGFPETVVKNLDSKDYLSTLFDSVLLNDVVKRYKVRYSRQIYELAVYLLTIFSSEYSFTRLRKVLGFRNTNTVQKYIQYLEEAYIVYSLNRFSFKLKNQLRSPRKLYVVDNGLVAAKSFQFSPNLGKLVENLVFVEALRKGYRVNEDIFYYKTRNGKEIDFVLRKGLKVEKLLQVCYQVDDQRILDREMGALVEASQELKTDNLIIVTWDSEGKRVYKGKEIVLIPLLKWLTE